MPIRTGKGASAVTNLQKRLASAFVLLPLVILATWFDKPIAWLTLGAAIWGGLALLEFYTLVRKYDPLITPLTVFGVIWAVAVIISPHLTGEVVHPAVFSIGITASLIWLVFRRDKTTAFASWVWTLAGVMFTGFLLSHLVALRLLPDGAGWVFLALFSVFASDTAAFFVGSIFKGRRLAPSISPHKTWSGSFGGIGGAMIASPIIAMLFNLPLSIWHAVLLGLAISLAGQLGDLVESLFKRNVSAKDSGNSVPGHGGCLDRMDSVVFGVVVVYYYVVWLV